MYRYVAKAVRVLAAQTPTLHDALHRIAAAIWSHGILDGKLFDTDRLAETTTSVKGGMIDTWHCGKHRSPSRPCAPRAEQSLGNP